jgi:hypothetical protein
MAVVLDAVGPGATGSTVNSITWTHTPVGTPSAVGVWGCGYNPAFSCTYGGTSMAAGTLYNPGSISAGNSQSFGLANPPSGAQTIVLSTSNNAYIAGNSISVTGSDTTTCFSNRSGNSGTVNNSTASVTSAVGELVVDSVGSFQATAVPSGAGGSQTSRYTAFWNTNLNAGISTQPGAAGTVTATWSTLTDSGTITYGASIDSFKAAAAAVVTATGATLAMMGVG